MKTPRFFTRMNKETARRQWSDRFNNRALAGREPKRAKINALADGGVEILLYDEIGFWGITATEFVNQLNAIDAPSITVRINSPGGDVFDGIAIHAALIRHPATITIHIDGLAASAASFIALAGKTVVMSESALMMVHCAWGFAIGNKSDMLETATILEKIDGQLGDIYAKKSGKTPAECLTMMAGDGKNDGTWFTAEEAKEWGLVDEIASGDDGEDESEQAAMQLKVMAMKRRLALAAHDD